LQLPGVSGRPRWSSVPKHVTGRSNVSTLWSAPGGFPEFWRITFLILRRLMAHLPSRLAGVDALRPVHAHLVKICPRFAEFMRGSKVSTLSAVNMPSAWPDLGPLSKRNRPCPCTRPHLVVGTQFRGVSLQAQRLSSQFVTWQLSSAGPHIGRPAP